MTFITFQRIILCVKLRLGKLLLHNIQENVHKVKRVHVFHSFLLNPYIQQAIHSDIAEIVFIAVAVLIISAPIFAQ